MWGLVLFDIAADLLLSALHTGLPSRGGHACVIHLAGMMVSTIGQPGGRAVT